MGTPGAVIALAGIAALAVLCGGTRAWHLVPVARRTGGAGWARLGCNRTGGVGAGYEQVTA
jgi:hypothetical protein